LEQRYYEIRPRGLEHRVALGGELRAHDVVHLDRELAQRIENAVAARIEHPLEPAVAREEGTLAVLHGHAQHHEMPVHGTSPVSPRGTAGRHCFVTRTSGFRTRLPVWAAGRGLSSRGTEGARARSPEPKRGRPNAITRASRAGGIRRSAEPVTRCLGAEEKPFGRSTGPRLKRASGSRQ